jgi:hypothetical protein
MTNKMKQTAVEWLIDMLVTENEITLKGENYKLFEIAKEMEKEQIIEAFDKGLITENVYYGYDNKKAEQYYNETFKSE